MVEDKDKGGRGHWYVLGDGGFGLDLDKLRKDEHFMDMLKRVRDGVTIYDKEYLLGDYDG